MNKLKKIFFNLFLIISLIFLGFKTFDDKKHVEALEPNVSVTTFAAGWNNLVGNGYSENIICFNEVLGLSADATNLLASNVNDIGNSEIILINDNDEVEKFSDNVYLLIDLYNNNFIIINTSKKK